MIRPNMTAEECARRLRDNANGYHNRIIDLATLTERNAALWDAIASRPRTKARVLSILRAWHAQTAQVGQ